MFCNFCGGHYSLKISLWINNRDFCCGTCSSVPPLNASVSGSVLSLVAHSEKQCGICKALNLDSAGLHVNK